MDRMKKWIAVLTALMLMTALLSCGDDTETATDTERPPTPYEEAVAYIEAGDVETAFYSLRELARAGDADAQRALADFSVGYLSYSLMDSEGGLELVSNTYDDRGNLILSLTTLPNGGERSYECTYEGDLPVSGVYRYSSEDSLARTYGYDAEGNLSTVRTEFSAGYSNEYRYEYDGEGRVVREIFSDDDGERRRTEYTYDGARVTRETHTYAVGESDVYEYTYDREGNVMREVRRYGLGRSDTYDYTYDERGGRTSETVTYSDGATERREWAYTYDRRGNISTVTHTEPDGRTTVETYNEYVVYYKKTAQ